MSKPIFDDKGADFLNQLGLSPYQAKVYVVLIKCGTLTAKEISTIASIPRQEVYRITSELLEKGFIEKHITAPESFQASDLKPTLKTLLESHRKENCQFEKAVGEFLSKYSEEINPSDSPALKSQNSSFKMVAGGKSFINKSRQEMEQTQKCLDILFNLQDFKKACFNDLWDWSKLLDRGVRVRWILTVPTKVALVRNFPFETMASELRVIYGSDFIRLGLYDSKKAFIGTSSSVQRCPFLYTDNQPLVLALQYYYNSLWGSAFSLESKNLSIFKAPEN